MQQIAVRAVQLEGVEADARRVAAANFSTRDLISSRVSACGGSLPSPSGIAEGATVCQPPSLTEIGLLPSKGAFFDPRRPACAICNAYFACPYLRQCASTRASAASFASLYRPEQP